MAASGHRQTLARRWLAAGHKITYGSRNPAAKDHLTRRPRGPEREGFVPGRSPGHPVSRMTARPTVPGRAPRGDARPGNLVAV